MIGELTAAFVLLCTRWKEVLQGFPWQPSFIRVPWEQTRIKRGDTFRNVLFERCWKLKYFDDFLQNTLNFGLIIDLLLLVCLRSYGMAKEPRMFTKRCLPSADMKTRFDEERLMVLVFLCWTACKAEFKRSIDGLFIETLTGTAFELRVSPFETIMSVKAKIQRLEGELKRLYTLRVGRKYWLYEATK